jgi:hypothetical protein
VTVQARVQAAADPNASPEARQERLHELVQLGPSATPALLDLLGDANANVRAVAAYALGQISRAHGADARTVDALITLLEHDREPVVRMNAASALGDLHDPNVVAPLAALLDEDDISMRRIAVVALSRTGQPAAVEPLVRIFRKETDPEIRQNVIRGLGELRAVEELTDLQQSLERESPLWWDIEAQLQSRRGATVAEGKRQPPATVPGAFALYFLLIRTRPYLLAAAFVLLAAPAVVLGIWSLAGMLPQGVIARLAATAMAAVLAVFFGGIASLPGFAVEFHAYDPTGPPLMLIPFMGATMTLPVVLCSCFIILRLANSLTTTLLNAVTWAGVYAVLQFGTWRLIPIILDGHYFFLGTHPGWYATETGRVVGAGVACAVTAALIGAVGRRAAWSGRLDATGLRTYIAVTLPTCAALGVGYLIINLYSY